VLAGHVFVAMLAAFHRSWQAGRVRARQAERNGMDRIQPRTHAKLVTRLRAWA
jgi:hypothetical protein